MARWDEIAAILAISLAIFNILPHLPLFQSLAISLLRHCHAPGTRCRELLWKDVPEGPLHQCPAATPWLACKHKTIHVDGPDCWRDLFSVVFSRAWADRDRQRRNIPKPDILPLSEDFIHIDFKVLMAFFISTIGCDESLGCVRGCFSAYTDKDEIGRASCRER